MVSNKKLIPIVTELFIRGIKLNISRIVLENIKINSTHYFIMKLSNKRGFQ